MSRELISAVLHNPGAIRALAKGGADLDAPLRTGKLPLGLAAEAGNVASVTALLEAGARIDAMKKGQFGRTALLEALMGGHEAVATLLLDRGATVTAGVKGNTPREWAMANEGALAERIRAAAEAAGAPFGGRAAAKVVRPWEHLAVFHDATTLDRRAPMRWVSGLEHAQIQMVRLGAVLAGPAARSEHLAPRSLAMHLLSTAKWTKGQRFTVKPKAKQAAWLSGRTIELGPCWTEPTFDADRHAKSIASWIPFDLLGKAGTLRLVGFGTRVDYVGAYDEEEPTDDITCRLGELDEFLGALELPK